MTLRWLIYHSYKHLIWWEHIQGKKKAIRYQSVVTNEVSLYNINTMINFYMYHLTITVHVGNNNRKMYKFENVVHVQQCLIEGCHSTLYMYMYGAGDTVIHVCQIRKAYD